MAPFGVHNKLKIFWEGFAGGTNVFLENFDPSDRPLRIPLMVLLSGLDQLLDSSTSWLSLPRSIFDFSSLLIPFLESSKSSFG